MAKSLANGVPVGACWAKGEVASVFEPGDHGSTFGGQPLAMAAARATLSTLIEMDVPEVARSISEQLTGAISSLTGVEYIRGMGLLLGIVLEEGLDASMIVADCLANGLIINSTGPGVLRIAPPYVITEADVDEAVTTLKGALDRAHAVRTR